MESCPLAALLELVALPSNCETFKGVDSVGLALLARTAAESPKAANAPSARGEEPRRTEFDLQGQRAAASECYAGSTGRVREA
jgi:hypothetical protein